MAKLELAFGIDGRWRSAGVSSVPSNAWQCHAAGILGHSNVGAGQPCRPHKSVAAVSDSRPSGSDGRSRDISDGDERSFEIPRYGGDAGVSSRYRLQTVSVQKA